MELIEVRKTGLKQAVQRSAEMLEAGGIVAFPTETLYGLGARYDRPGTLERLYAVKQRPLEKAMPLIIGHKSLLACLTETIPAAAELLMRRFWPGPLTLLLPARTGLSSYLTAGSGKIAVRIPGPSFALSLVQALAFPITATSANLSASPPASSAAEVSAYFADRIDLIIDAGRTGALLPSTIVDATGPVPVIMRHGALDAQVVMAAVQG